jgi:hypothetical protein
MYINVNVVSQAQNMFSFKQKNLVSWAIWVSVCQLASAFWQAADADIPDYGRFTALVCSCSGSGERPASAQNGKSHPELERVCQH